MKNIIISLLFMLLFFVPDITAQSKVSFSLGGGYVPFLPENTKLPYWNGGYLINFSSEYKLSENAGLFFSTSYQKNNFDESLVTFAVPAVVGYRFDVTGENSSVYEFSIGGKIYSRGSMIRSYFDIGTGLLLINQGRVEIIHWMEGSPNRFENLYQDTGKNYILAQFNLGLGVEIELYKSLKLDFDGKMMYSFNGPSYFPVTALLKIGI